MQPWCRKNNAIEIMDISVSSTLDNFLSSKVGPLLDADVEHGAEQIPRHVLKPTAELSVMTNCQFKNSADACDVELWSFCPNTRTPVTPRTFPPNLESLPSSVPGLIGWNWTDRQTGGHAAWSILWHHCKEKTYNERCNNTTIRIRADTSASVSRTFHSRKKTSNSGVFWYLNNAFSRVFFSVQYLNII